MTHKWVATTVAVENAFMTDSMPVKTVRPDDSFGGKSQADVARGLLMPWLPLKWTAFSQYATLNQQEIGAKQQFWISRFS